MNTKTMSTVSILFLFTIAFLPGCQSEPVQQAQASTEVPQGTGSGVVAETMDSGGYTYMRLESDGKSYWVATTQMKVQVGDEVDFAGGSVMQDFRSASLNRTFPYILFAGSAQVRGAEGSAGAPAGMTSAHSGGMPGMPSGHPGMSGGGAKATADASGRPDPGSIPKVSGALTLAEVFADTAGLSGKDVKVVGKVVKVNPNIMGTNWIHIQDGTEHEGNFDLLVTFSENAPQVGSIVTAEGRVITDKDFGAGYSYEVLLEGSAISMVE